MDVKTTFLNGELKEEVYVSQPEGFVDQNNASHVYKLKKALYGLKQAPRAWYNMLSSFLISQHFSKGVVDPTLFTRKVGNNLLLVQIYVDDIIFASTNTSMCNEFANLMTTKFKMTMMGQMPFFLGLQISQSPRGIFQNQSKYASKIIKKYGLLSSDSINTPMLEKNNLDEDRQGTPVDATLYRGMIGSLMYSTSSRPDLIYAVCLCVRYQAKPIEKYLNADTRRSTSGSAQFLGDKLVSWSSKKQKSTVISNYGFQFNKIPLYCDYKSAISLCCNNVQHSRDKHIDVRYHFIKEQVENRIVELYFVRMEYQLADIFTKPLLRERFNFLIEKVGMRSMSPKMLKRLTEEEDENMNPVVTQQVALDNSLVTLEKRLKIERCNARIQFRKLQREETYQLDKKKCRVDTEVFHEILQICLILPNQEFVELPSEEDLVSFIKELGYSGKCDMLFTIHTDQMHQPWRTFAAIINSLKTYYDFATGKVAPKKARKFKKIASPSRKLSSVKEVELVKKAKRVKRPAKKSTATPTTGVVIRDTLGESILKKKAPAKADRGKGIELLLDAALLKDAHLKKALEKSRQETHKLQASGLSEGANFKSEVPDESKAKPFDISEGTSVKPGKDESDDVNDDANDDDNANDDDSGNEDDDDEEQHDEEYESDDDNENVYEEEDVDLYKDVDIRSLGVEHEKERKGDEEMTDADQNVSQEKSYEYVIENAHVTLTSSQKTESLKQSSSISSNFSSKFLILDNAPPVVDEVASIMNVKNRQEESSTQAPSFFTMPLTAIPEISTAHTITAPPIISMITPLPQLTTPSPHQQPELYDRLVKSYNLDKDLFSSYGNVYSLTRDREDKNKDEDPPAGSNQGLKKRKTSKDAEPPKCSKSKESKSSSSKGTKPLPKSSGKSTQAEEPVFEAADIEMQQDQGSEFGHTVDKPNGEAATKSGWFKKPNKPPTPDHAWNTTNSIDFRLPQTWINNTTKAREPPRMFNELISTPIDFSAYVMNHLKINNITQEILVGPAFNLLKGSYKSFVELGFHVEECYKVVTDQLDWNKPKGHEYPFDLSKPLSLIKVQGRQVVPADYFFNNDLEYLKGGSSSRKYITFITKTKDAKYDNIEGIEDMVPTLWRPVKKLYKFMEGEFPRLNLHDIEDLMLLLVQKKLSNLEKDVIFDLNVAL
ncbi:retrovirus-related pol polyprotein from transposon TNT 1-94 [Tanacetum coccineum]|uniref:Retrovirus-related pol polyprotein from transposon TNT 1-94 n=1 Tax=Tanacetum coccineum TaxID=301880 RepID=A0ABQ5DAF6_9ASTR